MPDFDDGPRYTLSLLDRLVDERPGTSEESSRHRSASVRDVEASVQDNLAAILNTRRSDNDFPAGYPEAAASLLNYGVSDFTSMSLANPADREQLRRSIERAIRLFEPRLTRVQVSLDDWDPKQLGLQFRIFALLRLDPETEPIAFDALLTKDSREFVVREARG